MAERRSAAWGAALRLLVVTTTAAAPPLAFATLSACDYFLPDTHVRSGEIYRTGQIKYDDYFAQVHDLQVESARIPDHVRAARAPLVDALKLTMDSNADTIVRETRDRVTQAASAFGNGASLDVQGDQVHFLTASGSRGDLDTQRMVSAIEKTARAELALAKKLADLPPRADGLRPIGRGLEPHVREDFSGGPAAKIGEVRKELGATFDALDDASNAATRQIRDSQSLVTNLQRACAVGAPPSAGSFPPEVAPSAADDDVDAGTDGSTGALPATSATATSSAPTAPVATAKPPKPPYVAPSHPVSAPYVPPPPRPSPPPPPPPAPTSTGEVFNP